MKQESYTHQVVEFLRGKEIGHTFTSRSLHEDIITTPGQRHIPNPDLVSAALTRQRRLGAVNAMARQTSRGSYYEFTLVAPEKMHAMYTMRKPGKHDTCKAPRDLKPEPDLLTQTESMRGEQGAGPTVQSDFTGTFEYDKVTDPTSSDFAEVRFHIRKAFKAYKKRILHPLPEIAVRSIPTSILLEELTRRVKQHDQKTDGQAEGHKQTGS